MGDSNKDTGPDALGATAASDAPRADLDTLASDAAAATPTVTEAAQRLPEASVARYQLGAEVGRGGLGRVLRARDVVLDRTVAIKEMLGGDAGSRRRFVREAMITARLQHPSIVPVYEAARWKDQAPFYAMKLVSGRPLDEVLQKAVTLEARLALVPTILAVADAMAYAHGERIIHRDLKPGNVLVGSFGETVVIDWGLAKDLSIDDREALDAGPYREAAQGQTVAGAVMGTPAYMAPEQAAGDDVDERADVYALGAMLYHVLTGATPHRGKTFEDMVSRVLAGDIEPIATREPRVPADLAAIVTKAMRLDPAERYRTARELAEDLRRFQLGQLVGAHQYSTAQLVRRWARRHRAPLAVAGALTMVLAVFAVISIRQIILERNTARAERAAAVAAKAQAEAHRTGAEELVSLLVFELRDRLRPIGQLALLQGVGDSVVRYYDKVAAPETERTPLDRRAAALLLLGDVNYAKGDLDAARSQYEKALALRERLAERDPLDRQNEIGRSAIHEGLGTVALQQGRLDDALAQYRASQVIDEAWSARAPDDALWTRNRQVKHNHIGDVLLERMDLEGAQAEFERSLALAAPRAARDASGIEAQDDLSQAHERLGDVAKLRGDYPAAVKHYTEAMAITERIARAHPDNTELQRSLYVGHLDMGDLLLDTTEMDRALEHYRTGAAIVEAMIAHDPVNSRWQRDLMVAHQRIGLVHENRGDWAKAREHYQVPLDVMTRLAAKEPENTDWQSDLSLAHNQIGNVDLQQGNTADAAAHFEASVAIMERLVAGAPDNTQYSSDLAFAYEHLGDLRCAQKQTAACVRAYETARALRAAQHAAVPDDDLARYFLAFDTWKLALQRPASERAAVVADLRQVLALLEPLGVKQAENIQMQVDIAEAMGEIARHLEPSEAAEAKTLLDRALAILEAEHARSPLIPLHQDLLDKLRRERKALR